MLWSKVPKLNYKGESGDFEIIEITRSLLKELIKLLHEHAKTEEMLKLKADLEDDLDIMNIINEDIIPY
jgi:hypothetical protein